MTESARLADQIRRAFEGDAWHGDSLLEILSDVDAATATARPVKDAHTIWELLLHVAAWDSAIVRRSGGTAVTLSDAENFPAIEDTSAAAWRRTVDQVKKNHETLVSTVTAFPDARLSERVPGKTQDYYDFYYMFSGIVQHELYHAGQIAILKKAAKQAR